MHLKSFGIDFQLNWRNIHTMPLCCCDLSWNGKLMQQQLDCMNVYAGLLNVAEIHGETKAAKPTEPPARNQSSLLLQVTNVLSCVELTRRLKSSTVIVPTQSLWQDHLSRVAKLYLKPVCHAWACSWHEYTGCVFAVQPTERQRWEWGYSRSYLASVTNYLLAKYH